MELKDIFLNNWGRFEPSPATFTITEYDLPRLWGYIYTNDHILLKLNHNGSSSVQVAPPEGIMLHKQERYEKTPAFMVWLIEEGKNAFSNFFKPHTGFINEKPETYRCTFYPEYAEYELEHNGWVVKTNLTAAWESASIIMKVEITNKREKRILQVAPVWRAHNTKADLALWDVPELYQSCKFFNNRGCGVVVETRSPEACAKMRKYSALITDLDIATFELSYESYVGSGYFEHPEALYKKQWTSANDREYRLEDFRADDALMSQIPIAALKSKSISVETGEKIAFTAALCHLPEYKIDKLPGAVQASSSLLTKKYWDDNLNRGRNFYREWLNKYHLDSPDPALNRYINEWLPLQLYWISKLDRGWPTGMRGTRDAAQDYSGISYIDPPKGRDMLLKILACQRTDGSFLRQFSNSGPEGKHDARDYIDSGLWVFELFADYLNVSGDHDVLKERIRWLDSTEPRSVESHIFKLLDYYLNEENHGEHGLLKIKAGDWNDSINNAGLKGRGESVMASCQLVYILNLAYNIFPDKAAYRKAAEKMKAAIRKHALNSEGFLNGVFTDEGRWLFSDNDPDSLERVNSPVNSFAIIAGIFEPQELTSVIEKIKSLKGPNGYRLFYPPLGKTPIKMAGRMGSGDLYTGNAENGTVYNHGSQGFLIRALTEAGYGSMALETLYLALPYDQKLHPVSMCKTEPYGVVNCWSEVNGKKNEGEKAFFSGTISTVFRALYNGILGFKPNGKGINFSPCLPEEWDEVSYTCIFKSHKIEVEIKKCDIMENELYINGSKAESQFIPESELDKDSRIRLLLAKHRLNE
jgi:hypothetical protein